MRSRSPASNAGSGDEFGSCMAISGDTLLVGASRDDQAAASRSRARPTCSCAAQGLGVSRRNSSLPPRSLRPFRLRCCARGYTAVIGSAGRRHRRLSEQWLGLYSCAVERPGSSRRSSRPAMGRPTTSSAAPWSWPATSPCWGPRTTRGGVDAGSAYVFMRSGTAWSEQQAHGQRRHAREMSSEAPWRYGGPHSSARSSDDGGAVPIRARSTFSLSAQGRGSSKASSRGAKRRPTTPLAALWPSPVTLLVVGADAASLVSQFPARPTSLRARGGPSL